MKLEQVSMRMVKEEPLVYTSEIGGPDDAVVLIKEFLKGRDREMFIVVTLDTHNRPLNFNVAHQGTLNKAIVHPRDVFKSAILSNANAIVCFHNHPSGSLRPSDNDINITSALVDAGNILDIPLIDHIIVTDNGHSSIREHHGHLWAITPWD